MGMEACTDPFVRANAFEVATGWLHGLLPATPLPPASGTPREALDEAMLPALREGPCYVTFSGGRDSSAVLAAATVLARREGLDPPVPVTRVYPLLPDTEESEWQDRVIRHLGLRDWVRLEFTGGETDLLGPDARDAVRRRGLVWPAALQTHGSMFRHLGSGSIMTGEGGDAVLGFRRGSALAALRRGRRPSRALLGLVAESLLPASARGALLRRRIRASNQSRWLTPAALTVHIETAAAEEAVEPLRYDAGTWYITRRRFFAAASRNYAAGAAEFGLRSFDPLLDHGFIAALAHAGGRWGFTGRSDTMRALFSDVLPPPVLSRNSKASFNQAHTGAATHAFARDWDGVGVDPDLVDVAALRAVWLSEQPTMATGLLLHQAWLASGAPEP